MPSSIGATIARLRRRPRHERIALAVATYLAAASVIMALWVTSLGNRFAPGGATGVLRDGTAPAADAPRQTDADQRIASPLEVIAEGVYGIGTAFRETRREIALTIGTLQGGGAIPGEVPAGVELPATPGVTPPPALSASPATSTAPRPLTPAALLSTRLASEMFERNNTSNVTE